MGRTREPENDSASPRALIERLAEQFERFELKRARAGGRSGVYFLTACREGQPPVVKCGPDAADVCHQALGDRDGMKLCLSCREPRLVSQFSKSRGTEDGLMRDCKDCERVRLWRHRREKDGLGECGRCRHGKARCGACKLAAAEYRRKEEQRRERIARGELPPDDPVRQAELTFPVEECRQERA